MRRLHANLLLLLAALIWGVTFSVQQMAMEYVQPIIFTGIRFMLGAAIVAPLALREIRAKRQATAWGLSLKDRGLLVMVGTVLFAGAVLQQIGIKGTTVANAGFLTALYVPLTPILVFLVLRKTPHPSIWPAVIACVGGAYLMSGGSLDQIRAGDLWVIAGALFWALHILLIGVLVDRTGAPFVISCAQFTICGVLGLGLGRIFENLAWADFVNALPMILFSGAVSVGLGFTLQVVGQRHTPAADAAIILSAETVFAAIAGVVLLGEILGGLQIIGGALILAGILAVELLPPLVGKITANRTVTARADSE